jgi:hypothetical protein
LLFLLLAALPLLLVVIVVVGLAVSIYNNWDSESARNRRALVATMRAKKNPPRTCAFHFSRIKIGEMALLDPDNCSFCKENQS